MRLGTFNVENLFSRPRAMNQGDWNLGKEVLAEYSQLNTLLQKETYTAADKTAIRESLQALGLEEADENRFVILRQNRSRLVRRPQGGAMEVVADGRDDWIGWLELKTEAVNEVAIRMTARVIQDVNADVLAVIEAEDRIALKRFDDQLLRPLGVEYGSIMLIDGNDDRGIDVGLLARNGYTIGAVTSHVDDMDGATRVFSRDCPEITVRTPGGQSILVLVNHFKSKGYGPPAQSNARRKAQARRVREIYDQRRAEGAHRIAVVGDFNDTPDSDPLSPLLGDGSDLKDIFTHPQFQGDGKPGTYGGGSASNKLDYLLLSPALYGAVTAAGIHRKGVWGGANGTLFPHYDEMKRAVHAASDHAALWADITV
jgi:endonuclease/exonuclease/phosphatase family metal-dependent hydrolase